LSCHVAIRVTPRAATPKVGGWRDGLHGQRELDVRVREAPSDGAANEAVIRLLADRLGLPRSAIEISAGHSSRHKRITLPIDRGELERRLAQALPDT
jgi:uncharacterized protein YggU (UPF0235/DUF167 family)